MNSNIRYNLAKRLVNIDKILDFSSQTLFPQLFELRIHLNIPKGLLLWKLLTFIIIIKLTEYMKLYVTSSDSNAPSFA